MASYTDFQLPCLFCNALLSLFQLTPAPLVLFQRQYRRQISVGQSLGLLAQTYPRFAQILPTRLQLLRKPHPSLCAVQRLRKRLRRREQVTEILPDQFIELSSRNEARATPLITARNHGMTLASAGIVGIFRILGLAIAASTRKMTVPTTDQCTQQVGMRRIVAAGILLVLGQFCLHEIKLVLRDDGGNLSHGFPLLRSGGRMASMLVSHRT